MVCSPSSAFCWGYSPVFCLLLENIKDLERPRGREYDAWKEEQDRKRLEQEELKKAKKLEKKLKKQQRK